MLLVSVPRRGFRSLLLGSIAATLWGPTVFQSPEGDSGLCYQRSQGQSQGQLYVSVPRRGFRSLLRRKFHRRQQQQRRVSVPRRGFRSLLLGRETAILDPTHAGFSPPKGIQVFATFRRLADQISWNRFQSPEGDSGLCYGLSFEEQVAMTPVSVPRRGFRSLLLFSEIAFNVDGPSFSPPKGIQVFATYSNCRNYLATG